MKNKNCFDMSRRKFLVGTAAGMSSACLGLSGGVENTHALPFLKDKTRVSFVTGNDRRDMVFQSLKPFRRDIEKDISDKHLIVKVNMADKLDILSNTHPDAVRGLLDFLTQFYKKRITLAECTLHKDGFEKLSEEYGYTSLKREYNIDMVELHRQPTVPVFILGKNLKPQRIEVIDTFFDPDNYIISITPPKTHDVVVATIGLKNFVMAAPMKKWGGTSYKALMHGQGPWWLNYNLFLLSQQIRPRLTVVDGFEGMEGDGPIRGTKVEHKFALAGLDVIAVDRVALHLMGIDINDVGYITYCGQAGIGNIDLSEIKIIGSNKIDDHVIPYKKHKAFKYQLYWKKDVNIVDWDPKDLPY